MKKIICMLSLLVSLFSCGNSSSSDTSDEDTLSSDTIPESGVWLHSEDEDEMRDAIDIWDYIVSDNIVEFKAPYDGGSYLRIDIRYMEQYGTDVILTVSNGEFGGDVNKGTNYVTMKFDDESPVRYYYDHCKEGIKDCVFLKKKKELIDKFRYAQRIIIEAPFLNSGIKQFKFHADEPYAGDID